MIYVGRCPKCQMPQTCYGGESFNSVGRSDFDMARGLIELVEALEDILDEGYVVSKIDAPEGVRLRKCECGLSIVDRRELLEAPRILMPPAPERPR